MKDETFKSIIQWQRETFPEATKEGVINHVEEEWREFHDARWTSERIEEAIDLIIILVAYLDRTTSKAQFYINRKMAINRLRRWHIQEDGTGRHVD